MQKINKNNKILTMQDISCFGQCSITVALPILSSLGFETAILPSAILSTHTSGFKNFTFLDLTNEIPKILEHWQKEQIKFAAFYSGYLGRLSHIDYIKNILKSNLVDDNFKFIVDPVLADNGKLYKGFNNDYVQKIKTIIFNSDVILPNLSEACYLTGERYYNNYDETYIDKILRKLKNNGAKNIILTGINFEPNSIGIIILDEHGKRIQYKHKKIKVDLHGTGDIFSSVFVGLFLNGYSIVDSAKIAANFVVRCIENTISNTENFANTHWWGAKFEDQLPWLIKKIKNKL